MAQAPDPAGCAVPQGYQTLHTRFRWQVPARFNIAQVCCRRWSERPDAAQRPALHIWGEGALQRSHSYAELQQQADRLSQVLQAQGVRVGDRVAIVMPQRFETAVAYIAVLQMGAVAMPLSMLFGPEALGFRLQDSEAVLAIADAAALAALATVRTSCPQLRTVIGVGSSEAAAAHPASLEPADLAYHPALQTAAPHFMPVDTAAEDPAILIYTSGTTGNPKGALLPQRALIGNLSGFVCSQNWFGFDGLHNAHSDAVFWSPADWAWTGGLMDALLPTLYFGCSIVAQRGRFDPQGALQLMGTCGVSHTFLFPTAIKAMMKACPGSKRRTVQQLHGLRLQALMSAGEAMGDAVFGYCQQQLGVVPNEMFGQTEINYIVGNCQQHWPPKAGSMGMGYPGHRVAVIDAQGRECPVGVAGEVALHRYDIHGEPDPVFFLGY